MVSITEEFEHCWTIFHPYFPHMQKPALHIRNLSRAWGCCGASDITLTPLLQDAKTDFVQHVIFHEMCHLIYSNHKREFYDLLKQFDIGLREVTTFKKRPKSVDVHGRGGTEFQSVFNHLKTHTQYDGLIIFTDGYASEPQVNFKMRTKVLWVCRSEEEYQQHQKWMRHTGKVCWMKFD